MMKEARLKYIFIISSVFLLIMMLLASRDAGISCDEVLHYDHSVSVYNYFATHGQDKTPLETPVTHLKYYGQSYDNLVTIIIKCFKIENVYGFRHLMSSLAGWLTILLTALFAIWLLDYRAGIFVLLLFSVSPTFIGHAQNNLKDVPFALGYITAVFYTLKFLVSEGKRSITDLIILTVAFAFSMSIRAGGLLLICYLFFFFLLFYLVKFIRNEQIDFKQIGKKILWMAGVVIVAWIISIILWPYALQSPIKNVIGSYHVMAHFPGTFRQIFNGKVEWSDYMPWYYLPESISITISLVVLTGFVFFFVFAITKFYKGKNVLYLFVLFTILFPVAFVIYEKSNLYSSWRQFLFVYPGIVLLSAIGFHTCFKYIKTKSLKWGIIVLIVVLSIHPLKFMIKNHPYEYLYYNQLVGGLRGAYSNFETDYYYISQTEASKWLIEYLKKKNIQGNIKVKATFSVSWQFRNNPEIETSYFRYEERSQSDWDFAIVVNRYISPYQLKNKIWPPKNSIHVIYADQVPVCIVIERRSKDDFYGYNALAEGRNKDAVKYFEQVLKVDDKDEMIFYNFATALYNEGHYQEADSVLKKGLEINPESETILMYLGNIARSQNKTDEAMRYYEKVIKVNRKYFEAYVGLSELLVYSDLMRARDLLRTCLTMNPRYKPAIVALADTYRKSNPEIAKKYDDLANKIN
jgi:tetratricopeptide (TPR) repeat protein